jgi:hypothetical protein
VAVYRLNYGGGQGQQREGIEHLVGLDGYDQELCHFKSMETEQTLIRSEGLVMQSRHRCEQN